MMKYMEIDSTYRNRNQFPNPGQFNIINSSTGNSTALSDALDPVSLGCPIVTYVPKDIYDSMSDGYVEFSNTNVSDSITVSFSKTSKIKRETNYYRGMQFRLSTTLVHREDEFALGPAIIVGWDYLNTVDGNDVFKVSYYPALAVELYYLYNIFIICTTINFNYGNIFIPLSPSDNQFYKGYYIYNETRNEYEPILNFQAEYALASINPPSSWSLSDTISIREELPQMYGNFGSGSSNTFVILDSSSNPKPGFYEGTILRFTQPGSILQNSTYNIIKYSGYPDFIAEINKSIPVPPSSGDTYEILSFTRDNFVPLEYNGTQIQQEICYEIQNIALILPNVGVEQGGVMQSYPYFYVEFQNISTSNSGNLNIIYSNNPNSTQKLFRVPVTDISPVTLNAFVKLDKTYMSQNIKISPYSSFKFGVYLPDGRPLILSIPDYKSPLPPNPYLQISVLFSLKKNLNI